MTENHCKNIPLNVFEQEISLCAKGVTVCLVTLCGKLAGNLVLRKEALSRYGSSFLSSTETLLGKDKG